MVTQRTGRPRGRPKGAPNKQRRGVREDSRRYALAFADACMGVGMTAAKSFLLASLLFLAKKTEFSGELSEKMRSARKRCGGGMIVSYDISALSGDEHEELNEKRLQAINTLRKKAKRYVTEEDDTYRGMMSYIFWQALFKKGDVDLRAARISRAAAMIREEQAAALLIEAMRVEAAEEAVL